MRPLGVSEWQFFKWLSCDQAGLIVHMAGGFVSDLITDVDIGAGKIRGASIMEGLARDVSIHIG